MRSILTAAVLSAFLAGGVAAQEQEVYKPGNGVTYPRLIKEVKPRYTEGAMRRKVEGTVEVSAIVQKDGKTGSMYVTRSLDDELDEQAMKAVQEWEFRPGTKDGQPVNVEVSIELTFKIRN